jgi:hypothetical protein
MHEMYAMRCDALLARISAARRSEREREQYVDHMYVRHMLHWTFLITSRPVSMSFYTPWVSLYRIITCHAILMLRLMFPSIIHQTILQQIVSYRICNIMSHNRYACSNACALPMRNDAAKHHRYLCCDQCYKPVLSLDSHALLAQKRVTRRDLLLEKMLHDETLTKEAGRDTATSMYGPP